MPEFPCNPKPQKPKENNNGDTKETDTSGRPSVHVE